MSKMNTKQVKGFTLIELMVVVVIVAIFAAIAIPNYQAYMRKGEESKAMQEMLRVSQELERYKSKNFNYHGFAIGANAAFSVVNTSYTISIVDGTNSSKKLVDTSSTGQKWAMQANANDTHGKKFNFLLTSDGFKCKNKTFSVMTYSECKAGGINEW